VLAIIFIAFGILGEIYPLRGGGMPLGKWIEIYNGARDQYVAWDRDKATAFGLEQTVTSIKFLFVAAAAILGILSKSVIEPLLDPKKYVQIPDKAVIFLRHSAIGCFFSIFYGFVGFTYFIYLPVNETFSVFADVGNASNCQQLSFLFATAFMLVGINDLWKNRRLRPAEDEKGETP
jgi:hypothetical protein